MSAPALSDRPLAAKVEALTGFGLSAQEIARVLELDETELAQAYARELGAGAIKANARVAERLFRKATGEGREAVTAAIFWLKTRARWREVNTHEHTGSLHQGTALTVTITAGDEGVL
ncbi:MAG TPA: hypothetical protein VGN97_22745 [Mesorhizobium sp.]|jgi:hypothetical protein|nr:hypothetical protein [Mesorhizobium sp.]